MKKSARKGIKANRLNARAGNQTTDLDRLIKKALALSVGAVIGMTGQAYAGPEGGQVTGGIGSISTPNATTTLIQQQSQNLAIDWQSFNVATDELVRFEQPSASSSVLNRILDQNPSQIFGAIEANGNVFLSNPNGLIFGSTATVNVGSLFATGLDMNSDDFMNSIYQMSAADGEFGGVVINQGILSAATGGSVTLVGGAVNNEGVIIADVGYVNLASGRKAVVDFNGDGSIRFQVDEAVLDNPVDLPASVNNSGEIQAEGGQVLMSGNAAKDVFTKVVNNDGVIRAGSIDDAGGTIRLVGTGGDVYNSGILDASSENGEGGNVDVLGDRIAITDNALIDASGATGGGNVRIGGDYQGANPEIQNSTHTYVGADAVIKADATEAGDGGRVIVWADDVTGYYGSISARGGDESGNGGFAEVSGKEILDFNGAVDLSAENGSFGTLLLDPSTLTIIDAAAGGDHDADLPDILSGAADIGGNTVSWGAIDALGAAANVVLEATGLITIADVTGAAGGTTTSNNLVQLDLTTGSLTITSTGGAIDFSDTNDVIRTEGGTITLQAQGGNLTLGGLNTTGAVGDKGGTVNLLAANNLTQGAGIVSTNLNVTNTGGNTTLTNGANTFTSLAIDSVGSFDISTTGTLTALTVAADAGSGNENYSVADSGNLTFTVDDPNDDLEITEISVASGNLDLSLTNKDVDGEIQIDVIDVNAGSVSLNAGGAITDDDNGNEDTNITAATLNITNATNVGDTGNGDIDVAVGTLQAANVSGDTYIHESNGIDLASVSVGGLLSVTADTGDITATNVTATAGATTLTATAGGIAVGVINGSGQTVTLDAGTAITDKDTDTAVDVTATTLAITDATNVGASGADEDLDISVDTLQASNVSGNLYAQESNGIDLNAVTVGGVLNVTADAGNIAATDVTATSGATTLTATLGGISIGEIDGSGQTVTLDAGTTITDADTDAAVDVTASTLNITDATNVGTAAADEDLDIDVATLQSSNISGSAYLQESDGIDIATVSVNGTLDLTVGGNITESGTITASNLVITNAAGSTTLGGNNSISNLGAIDSTGGNFELTNTAALQINDAIDATGNDVTISNGANAVTFALDGATEDITASSLTVTAQDVDGLNTINSLGSTNVTLQPDAVGDTIGLAVVDGTEFTLTTADIAELKAGTGTVTIGQTDGTGAITLGAAVDLAGRTVTLRGGRISDAVNVISADSLTLDLDPNGSGANSVKTTVATLSVDTSDGNSATDRTITVTETNGVDLASVDVSDGGFYLNAAGSVTQSGSITASSLSVSNTAGSTTLTDANNDVDNLASNATGQTFSFTDMDGLNITTVNSIVGITATTANLSVGGDLTQTQRIVAANLSVTNTAGTTTLTNTSNDVDDLAADATGQTFSFTDTDDLNIGSVNGISGITADAVNLTVGAGAVSGALTQDEAVTATDLDITNTIGSTTLNEGTNDVTNLSATVTGQSFSYTDDTGLTIAGIAAGSGTVNITAGGALGQSGAITAANLGVTNTDGTTTLNAANDVDNLAADATGQDFAFTDADGVNIATVGSTIGITSATLDISAGGSITDSSPLNISGDAMFTTTAGGGSVWLDQANNIEGLLSSSTNGTGITYVVNLTDTNDGIVNLGSINTYQLAIGVTDSIQGAEEINSTSAIDTAVIYAGDGKNIELTNANNTFSGPVAFGVYPGPGTLNNVTFYDDSALTLNALTIAGDLYIDSGGALTINGALESTGEDIRLIGEGNVIQNADITAAKSAKVFSDTGTITMASGSTTRAGANDNGRAIVYHGNDDVTISVLETTATDLTVEVSSLTGSIFGTTAVANITGQSGTIANLYALGTDENIGSNASPLRFHNSAVTEINYGLDGGIFYYAGQNGGLLAIPPITLNELYAFTYEISDGSTPLGGVAGGSIVDVPGVILSGSTGAAAVAESAFVNVDAALLQKRIRIYSIIGQGLLLPEHQLDDDEEEDAKDALSGLFRLLPLPEAGSAIDGLQIIFNQPAEEIETEIMDQMKDRRVGLLH